jgi:hypothetical protein
MSGHRENLKNPEIRSEKSDAHPGAILRFLLWLVFGTVVVAILLRWMFVGLASYEEAQQPPPPVMKATVARQPPGPQLQEQPAHDLTVYREAQERELHAYGWVDRQAGVVRIDVDRAMALIAERGLPVREGQPAPAGAATPTGKGKK